MNVLHLVYNLIRGGTEGQCARVAMGLTHRQDGHRVAVFRREGYFLEAVERACGPVYVFDIRKAASLATLVEIRRLARWIREQRIQWVHAWDMDACLFGYPAARLAGVPFIASRRNLSDVMPAWKRRGLDAVCRRAAAVVVNAKAIEQALRGAGVPPQRIVRIPNILDLEEFDRLAAQAASRAGADLPGRLLVSVARLAPEKDVGLAIKAMARLAADDPDVALLLLGEGAERPALEGLAAELGVPERVHFMGEVNDTPSLLARCSIGLLTPKANEGLSNSILEYMAARLPVVATDCGGNRELLESGPSGLIVPVGDVAALTAALRKLLDRPDQARALGLSGRAQVERNHRPEAVCATFSELYQRITKNQEPRTKN